VRCARQASAHRRRLQLRRARSLEEAVGALGNGSRALAGGTELVPLLRDRLVEADTLVDIRGVVPRGIDGAHIGAGTTLGELEIDPQIPSALREACRLAASPQLRAMGTIGGNLLQATRCWYWRLKFPCYLHGGDRCHAKAGQHGEHAIFGNERCASAHPSDPAAALLALGARLRTTRRELTMSELYRLPTDDDRNVTTLEPGELILELDVPTPAASVYLKAMDRRAWSFPLVGVAAARRGPETRIALAGVAPIPWALDSPDELERSTPLPGSAYKVEIARALVRRALDELAGRAPAQAPDTR
jgi:xanthine dehydrogenase YagS FAD-binding subunit